jgi:hypothetical protein
MHKDLSTARMNFNSLRKLAKNTLNASEFKRWKSAFSDKDYDRMRIIAEDFHDKAEQNLRKFHDHDRYKEAMKLLEKAQNFYNETMIIYDSYVD